jgi:carboxypeptidase C (cathepsin A)
MKKPGIIILWLLLMPLAKIAGQNLTIASDTMVITNHRVTVNGKEFSYQATTGTQPVWNEKGESVATLFYTYYERSNIADRSSRPLVISFNGGPGSASVWMHLAYTGPRKLNIDEEGFPVQPYGVMENPYTILDIADIVYVNPVNTAFSRITVKDTTKIKRSDFFGVNSDIKYLAEWLTTFVSRKNRWRSPKYLIGESYGTTRVSGLALELQNKQWMYLNGVILVSPTDIGIRRDGPVKIANRLPYFTAAAWYQKALSPSLQNKDLDEILPEVEQYAIEKLLPALAKGGFIEESIKKEIAVKVAYYSGLKEKEVLQNNLQIPVDYFWKALLRERGYTIGRLDSRYLGIDESDAGVKPDYNSEIASWLHSFTPAINYYLREELNFKTNLSYYMFGPVRPWDRNNNRTGSQLRQAMAQNPYLHVLVQSGYFDGATNYFDAKYTMWHIDSKGKMKDRLEFKGYRSGHMMYLRKEDLIKASNDLKVFIKRTMKTNKPAKYE